MYSINLNGSWKMKEISETEWIEAIVPGSVMNDLLRNGKIEDPFYRDNEDQAFDIASKDYEFVREFTVNEDLLQNDKVNLYCEGIDTLSEIFVNGKLLAKTDNMHRTYSLDVKSYLKIGSNEIKINLFSPIRYITEKQEKQKLWGVVDAISGYPHIRKAHSMFGWDWGPKIPDLGIWRNISIQAFSIGKIEDVYITQKHEENKVNVDVRIRLEKWHQKETTLEVKLTHPDGTVDIQSLTTNQLEEFVSFTITNPELWWPNGYGEQPLYKVEVLLTDDNESLDEKVYQIGLRTIRVKHEPDEWGKSFEFVVNGLSIFAMGANYIPEDNILARTSKERTEQLLKDCLEANFNMIRVWGGGYYPDDYFFDLCDRMGLIVWQDFMFACSVYELTDEFTETVKKEAIDNIKRIRHHASLGIWCGNNEVEEAWVYWGDFPKDAPKRKTDYIKLFEVILPDIIKETDPQTFYWPSSPSSGGGFDAPRNPDVGDMHYWEVWHGLKPFTEYRKFYFRFCSEFGFQSFPSMKTIESFTLPEDRNIFSYVMEKHQKNGAANGKILFYLSENFLYPKDFHSLLYVSQLLQAEAIKYGVEHWRRNRGRCMGSLYWQLNDCWPVASWSSIDSNGRWKALHYFAKKFYSPILLSVQDEEKSAKLFVTNDTVETVHARIEWKLRSDSKGIIKEGIVEKLVPGLSAALCESLSFEDVLSPALLKETYLESVLYIDNQRYSSSTTLFIKPKHYQFQNPQLKLEVSETGDQFVIAIKAGGCLAKYVELDLQKADGKFSDNYFDLSSDELKEIIVLKEHLSEPITLEQFKEQLSVRSIYDMA